MNTLINKPIWKLGMLLVSGLLFTTFACNRQIDPIIPDDINDLLVPASFNYVTSDDLELTITDPDEMTRYEVYTLTTDQDPEVVITETDTIIMIESSNQLITQGLIKNGSWTTKLSFPGHQEFLYLRRFQNGAYSGITLEITGNSMEYHHSGMKFKSSVSEDVIYTINDNGNIGYFTLSEQTYHELSDVSPGSSALAVDKANNVLYYAENKAPYSLHSINLTSGESTLIDDLDKKFTRMAYKADEGLIYLANRNDTYTYDPFSARFISKYKISNYQSYGDFCFGPDDKLYLVRKGLFWASITGSNTSYTTILDPLSTAMNGSCFGSDGNIYSVDGRKIYRINPADGSTEYLFDISKSSNDLGILLKDTEESNPDTDGDGVPNDTDEYPDDPDRAYNTWYPGEKAFGTLAYEDLWPSRGDYDFNDMVIDYKFKHIKNADNLIVAIGINFRLRAIGGSSSNGFGFQLALSPDQITQVVSDYSISAGNLSISDEGLENGQDLATIIVFANGFNVLTHPGGGLGINTNVGNSYVDPVEINIEITLSQGFDISTIGYAPNNPFIFRTDERGREIHLPGYPPTDLVNTDYFGTGNDATDLASGYYYKTQNGLPWGMNIPISFTYPLEKVTIVDGYLTFAQWAASGGFSFMDWYIDLEGHRNNTQLYIKE